MYRFLLSEQMEKGGGDQSKLVIFSSGGSGNLLTFEMKPQLTHVRSYRKCVCVHVFVCVVVCFSWYVCLCVSVCVCFCVFVYTYHEKLQTSKQGFATIVYCKQFILKFTWG